MNRRSNRGAGRSTALKHHLTYISYLSVWETVARLPEPIAWRLPDHLGDLWYRFGSSTRRRQVHRNLARVLGHPSGDVLTDTVREAYRSYARYWVDSFRAHTFDPDEVLARSEDDGLEALDELAESGDGGILATGHLGSWDMGAFYSTQRGWRLVVVAEVLEPRALFERFVRLREGVGLEVIPLVRGGDMVEQLEGRVRAGGIATLLADRDLTRKGPIVDFFGEPCRLPPGPAALARRTGRPVVPGAFFSTPTGWRGVAHGPLDLAHLDVAEGTQRLAHALEDLIREAPEQWHVFLPNWLVEREPDHPLLTGGASGDEVERDR